MPRPAKISCIFPTAITVLPFSFRRREAWGERFERKVASVSRSSVISVDSDKRARDDPSDGIVPGQDTARDPRSRG